MDIVSLIAEAKKHHSSFDSQWLTGQEIAIHRIVNKKIVEQWTVSDSLGLYQQLGMELKPKEVKNCRQ